MNDLVRYSKHLKHLQNSVDNTSLIYHEGLKKDSTIYVFLGFFHDFPDCSYIQ